jgi:hypothetical protein
VVTSLAEELVQPLDEQEALLGLLMNQGFAE